MEFQMEILLANLRGIYWGHHWGHNLELKEVPLMGYKEVMVMTNLRDND